MLGDFIIIRSTKLRQGWMGHCHRATGQGAAWISH